MNKVSKVIDVVVKNNLCIGCGLCTYKCTKQSLKMKWSEEGFLIPESDGTCDCDGSCISVCPFNPEPVPEVKNEDELGYLFLQDSNLFNPRIGRYSDIYTGYSIVHRESSSSGGMATFVLLELLERGIVDHVFSVKESISSGVHYEYVVSNSKEELLKSAKTRYFPVTLSDVFSKIEELNGRVAIVGVGCFIKAIRLAQYSDPQLKNKIPFLVGIICGGVKSKFFTEYLSDTAGVQKDSCGSPSYRIKDFNTPAGDYSFGCHDKEKNREVQLKMKSVGDMWGSGLFKANACDFCDDVTTELADISLGDAWLSPYDKDGRGTSVIVSRSSIASQILKEGVKSGKLQLENLSIEKFIHSQQGSFNHRQDSIQFRMEKAKKAGFTVPPKRIRTGQYATFDFKIVQFYRMKVRKKSLETWKKNPNSSSFNGLMKNSLLTLKFATKLYHFKRAITKKGFLKKVVNKFNS
jgi:coenzyme F420 hydrogenase subunit beta